PSVVEDPRYLADWVAENPLILPNLEQLEILEPWESMPGPNYAQIGSIMMDAAEMAVYGGVDVEGTLADAKANAQALMPCPTMPWALPTATPSHQRMPKWPTFPFPLRWPSHAKNGGWARTTATRSRRGSISRRPWPHW